MPCSAAETGRFHSGALTGVSGCCRLRIHGAVATFLSTSERAWRGAMRPRKRSGSQQQGLRNSRASLSSGSNCDPEHQTGKWQAASPSVDQLRRDRGLAEDRPENTGAGSKKHGGTECAAFPDGVVTGLHDASRGACGEFCLCGRDVFLRKLPPASFFAYPTCIVRAAVLPSHIPPHAVCPAARERA